MNKEISVYLAGPFFNEQQLATVKMLENYLESRGYKVYSPRRDGVAVPGQATYNDREQIFKSNVEHTTQSDLIVAVIDDRDTGTSWEMGCRYGYWLSKVEELQKMNIHQHHELSQLSTEAPIITFTAHDYGVNLMLLHSILQHCRGVEELGKFLDIVDEVGINDLVKNEESIINTKFI